MLEAESPVRYAREPGPRTQLPEPTAVAYAAAPLAPTDSESAYAAFWSWLHASRRLIDFWRIIVREQQDAMIRFWQPRPPQRSDATPAAKP